MNALNRQDAKTAKTSPRANRFFVASLLARQAAWRSKFLCVIALVALIPAIPDAAARGGLQETAEQFIERVRKAIKNDEWGRAESGLKHAFALKKDIPEAYLLLAQVYLHGGKLNDAVAAVTQAVSLQPFYSDGHLLLAELVFRTGDRKRAQAELDVAFQQGAHSSAAYKLKGDLEIVVGNYQAAVDQYEEALRRAASDDDLSSELRRGVETLKKRIEAIRSFKEIASSQEGAGYTKPRALNNPRPNYTPEARQHKIMGTISLAALVDEQGGVASVLVLSLLGYGLDEEAERAAREMKFSPAEKEGKPVPYWVHIAIDFSLR